MKQRALLGVDRARPSGARAPVVIGLALLVAAGCGPGGQGGSGDLGPGGDMAAPVRPATSSRIEHVIVLWQENHTFDNYFGSYCKAPTGSNPVCNVGPSCCEAAPEREPAGNAPIVLDDAENASFSPDHHEACEVQEIDGGKMDGFVAGPCGLAANFAYAPASLVFEYHQLAARYALADRWFQPTAGQSSMNDMYFARAREVFVDNQFAPPAIGNECGTTIDTMSYDDPTVGDLLSDAKVPWAVYLGGYRDMLDARAHSRPMCPAPSPQCPGHIPIYPCIYDPSDNPFNYYSRFRDDPVIMRDLGALYTDLDGDRFPSVSFVRGVGYQSEHGALGTTISDGVRFVTSVVDALAASKYAATTLLLFTYDEGGGFFDHVSPPPASAVDHQPYGTRVPALAIGAFARQNFVSHVTLEHSSIIKFIEWNWLGGKTGQLGTRDVEVHNLGSLLDPAMTGTVVPEM